MVKEEQGGHEKVALVTGGAVRLGRGVSLALAELGCRVLIHYNNSESAALELQGQIEAMGLPCHLLQADLGRLDEIQRLFEQIRETFGGLDYLVNNAAIFQSAEFESITSEQLESMWRVNAAAPFYCSQLAAGLMRPRGGGSIVNIADIAGERPFRRHAHYCMSKAAVLMLTRCLAIELAPSIRVNAVSPGAVLFPESYDERKRSSILRRIPMARVGSVSELAQTVVFLLTGPGFVNGQVVAVDGGRSAML